MNFATMRLNLSPGQGEPMQAGHADSIEQAKQLGFWFYLMSDAVIFALLFATFLTMNEQVIEGSGRELVDLAGTLLETLFLLCSTLTCGLAMIAVQNSSRPALGMWLAATLLLGAAFLTMELQEFRCLIQHGAGPSQNGYLSAFFTLTGTHGLHVFIGCIWLSVMLLQVACKGLTRPVMSRLYRFSLFWHFLDLIWVCIFSAVYLPQAL